MTTFQPSVALKDRVASISVVGQSGQCTVLPTAGAVLGLQLRGRVRAGEVLLSTTGITGIQKKARQYTYVGDTISILVRFTPQGAACLGVPASDLANQSVPLTELLPEARVREVHERLLAARGVSEQIALVEGLLLKLPFVYDRLIARALKLLELGSDEDAVVASVARSLALSERQLERRFLRQVGITPKRFATLRRFERAVMLARTASSLTSAALDAGYYDQSHFIREFRRFANMPPGVFLHGRR